MGTRYNEFAAAMRMMFWIPRPEDVFPAPTHRERGKSSDFHLGSEDLFLVMNKPEDVMKLQRLLSLPSGTGLGSR